MNPITIAVFGASGATGRELVRQALDRGFKVHAHVRPSSHWQAPKAVVVFRSELHDVASLRQVVRNCDAVFCVIGTRPPHRDVFCADATKAIIDAMRLQKVNRLLCLTGAMAAPNPQHLTLPIRAMAALFRRMRPLVAADRRTQELLVCESDLQWTVFKPGRLTDGPASDKMRVGTDLRVGLRSFISRTDIAAQMLAAAEQHLYVQERLYLDAA